MFRSSLAALLALPTLVGCGSAAQPGDPTPTASVPQKNEFPPVTEGYTRIVAPTIKDLGPGADVTHCQFVLAPVDHDIDILDLVGYQSKGGHHSLAYATTTMREIGYSDVCGSEDKMSGSFVGGTGGEGTAVTLPPGVAFRLPKGSGIMLNTHFINPSEDTLQGETVLDFKFADADGSRQIAAFFSNGTRNFDIPVAGKTTATAECVAESDMRFILFTSHMHEFGTFGETVLARADSSAPEVIHTGDWIPEYQAAPVWSKWSVDAPLLVKKGDTLRSRCEWSNRGTTELTFPREMCFGIGFFISDDLRTPVCLDGKYL